MRIGELATRAAVNVQTLRYYERRGLLPEPARRQSGYRQYDNDAVRRVRFIKHAQALGFTLEEIAALMALRVNPGTACPEVESRAEATIGRIDRHIADLRRMRRVLAGLTRACVRQHRTGDCPILQALDDEDA